MKKGKRKISMILVTAMLLGSLCSCGNADQHEERKSIVDKYRNKNSQDDNDIYCDNTMNGVVYEETACDAVYDSSISNSVQSKGVDCGGYDPYLGTYFEGDYDTREYNYVAENRFVSVLDEPLSTFAADVDTASYSNIRGYIESGSWVPSGAVRIEEMINYFHYNYGKKPKEGEKFAITTELAECPWNQDTQLLMLGINTEEIDFSDAKPSNLVFLIDTSGSMFLDNKLPLAQKAFDMLAENLDEKDRVSIVTYAGTDTVVLSGVAGSETYTITEAIDSLTAWGSTNGGDGILTAYDLAEKYFIEGGNNRVILATDGDLNVGLTSESDLVDLITEEKESGIYLSVLGFGMDNLKDNKLEALADYGNGNYAFIDSVYEAKKVLVDDMGGTLYTVANDVKFQIEFNPEYIKGYRLIGYENRMLDAADFADDSVDGGEIGAGHYVTALYEVVPVSSSYDVPASERRYSQTSDNSNKESMDVLPDTYEVATINIRYKEPGEETSKLITEYVECAGNSIGNEMSEDFRFISAVAAFGMLLKESQYSGTADYDLVLSLAGKNQEDEYRQQFVNMVKKYMEIDMETDIGTDIGTVVICD